MKNKRRDFLKWSGLVAGGLTGMNMIGCNRQMINDSNQVNRDLPKQNHTQKFNMVGYAAPKLEKVRIGNIGIGNRGSSALNRLTHIEGVEIKAVCDIIPERATKSLEKFSNVDYIPETYSGNEDEWKKVCERDDIDLIYIT